MAKKYYQVMVRHFFSCQDGYDYMDGEYSGIIHTRMSDAKAELKKALREEAISSRDEFFIEEIENG